MSVEFVQKELCCLYFRVNSTQKQKSSSSDTRNTKVLEKLSLTDFPNAESSDWKQMSDPGEYCEQSASVQEEDCGRPWEGVSFKISLKEIIPVSCEHESKVK
jgi:hypothetical protein